MKKIFTFIAVLLLVITIVLFFGKNIIARTALSRGVDALTGLKLRVDDIDVGITKTMVDVKGLKLFNPLDFPDKLMMDMPEVYVDYDLPAFVRGEAHLEELRLNLREFVVVKNRNGKLNLDSLKVVQAIKEKSRSHKRAKNKTKPSTFRIDLLKLKIGKAIYKDYSKGPKPAVVVYDINIDEQFKNITHPYAFLSLIIAKSLTKTPIEHLAGFDLGPIKKEATKLLEMSQKIAQEATSEAIKASRELEEKTRNALEKIFPFGK